MKKIFLGLLVCAGLATEMRAQGGSCTNYHRMACAMEGSKKDAKEFMYNAQSKSGLFAQGSVSKMRCVVYKGNDYRISVCCETILGDKVNFKIFDAKTNELLFDNTQNEDAQQFEFSAATTRPLVIEVAVPEGTTAADKGKTADAACVGLLIENKVSARVGF